jgi:hypothetical protein
MLFSLDAVAGEKIVFVRDADGRGHNARFERDDYILKGNELVFPGPRIPFDVDAFHTPAFLAAKDTAKKQKKEEQSVEQAQFKVLFDLTNRTLALEGKPTLTRQQFIDWATK